HLTRCLGERTADGDEIALGFGHLGAADGQHAVMHPVAGKILRAAAVMGADALRDLVLVVREDQVEAAAMDVEGLSQRVLAHCRAFDMQAWSAASPWDD